MKTFPISLIVVIFLVTACGSRPTPTFTPYPTDTPVPPTATPYLQPPDGTYSTTITMQELIGSGMQDAEACENAGVFDLTVAGERWDVVQTAAPGCTVLNPTFGGSWHFTGNQVTFHDDAPFGCKADYTYKWSFTGSVLRFTSVDDADCVGRVDYMSMHPWDKTK